MIIVAINTSLHLYSLYLTPTCEEKVSTWKKKIENEEKFLTLPRIPKRNVQQPKSNGFAKPENWVDSKSKSSSQFHSGSGRYFSQPQPVNGEGQQKKVWKLMIFI